MNLALNVFHDSNHASLILNKMMETADFIQIISLWDVLNTRSISKGKIKRKPLSYSIDNANCIQMMYLEKNFKLDKHLEK